MSWKAGVIKSAGPLLVIAGIYVFGEWFKTTALCAEQGQILYWNYLFHAVFFLPPCLAILVNRARIKIYGLSCDRVALAAKIGALFAAPLIAAPLVTELVVGTLQVRTPLHGRILQSIFYQVVMIAGAEELLFRGYLQGELNRVLPAAGRLFGIRITVGFWVTAVVFAACHVSLRSGIGLWDAIYVAASAVLFGLLRERTQSLAAPALAHLGCIFHRNLFGMGLYAGIATGAAWFFIFLWLPRLWTQKGASEPVRDGRNAPNTADDG